MKDGRRNEDGALLPNKCCLAPLHMVLAAASHIK